MQVKMPRMKEKGSTLEQLRRRFDQLRQELGQVGCVSQGSVQDRTARSGGGAGYQWTRKIGSKTITVALTSDQFREMKQAIDNQRRLRRNIKELENISRQIIFQTHPHPARLKRLSNKVLGVN
jgi:hypothetical protein